jgi:transitional endoplasmic reticulum ATPase
MARPVLRLVPLGDRAAFDQGVAEAEMSGAPLRDLLCDFPALSADPLEERAEAPVVAFSVEIITPEPGQALYWPPGLTALPGAVGTTTTPTLAAPTLAGTAPDAAAPAREAAARGGYRPGPDHPDDLDELTAVRVAYDQDIAKAAEYLGAGLSVLVRSDKLLVEYLAQEIALRSGRETRFVPRAATAAARPERRGAGAVEAGGGRRQQILAELQEVVRNASADGLIVVAHLDLLAGGSDASLSPEARELIDVLYEPGSKRSKVVLLAFVDPSLTIPEVLANRFAVRLAVDRLPQAVLASTGEAVSIGTALVTRDEAAAFAGFDAIQLYKHVAGLDAIRLRHAMIYARRVHPAGATFADLLSELRVFKATSSAASFEVPKVPFSDIGGYPEVKRELGRALALIQRADRLPEDWRRELVPRGFIFYGPPGTGKTMFAKAVATELQATILVVSGPEVTDMYVGESERKVREIFAEARRNAPAIVVFDEFDSIASRRSGREDGGSRAGNAIVAQLLTEMDGFRPEVAVLVIGTTNRLDIIDEALLRPSRFRPIQIELPKLLERKEIAAVHARHFKVDVGPALLDRIAAVTREMNGDEIHSIFRDAVASQMLTDPDSKVTAAQLGALVGTLRKTAVERGLSAEQAAGSGRPPRGRPGRPAADTEDSAEGYTAVDPDAEAEPDGGAEGGQ